MKAILAAYAGVLRTGSSIISALQDLSPVFWRSQIQQQLQVISVMQWILSFLILGPGCTVALIYLFSTSFWLVAAVYTAWFIYDWNTPQQVGRRSLWIRNWTVWTYFRDYFPIRLVKTQHLCPSRNYIFGYHPHGIFCIGAFCNFATDVNGFLKLFPGIRPFVTTLAGNFQMPIVRDYLMGFGICPVTRDTLDYILSQNGTGNAVVIVVGGATESLGCTPGVNIITLKNRKGFVKMALQQGADLVPVYSFGENEVYKQLMFEEGSLWKVLQRKVQKLLGFAPCLFYGRGFFSANSWGMMPFSKPITSVVGEPITVPKTENPSQEVLDHYHTMYINSLRKLFDQHKTKYGLRENEVLVIQ
ncbi:hypothetical protein AAFF_G00346830 [Aldrovandia affinis]|uniref:Acyltransferase n=1 Tax=Aldrovandia affinis TaxID=143900 RepID=A0AAD7WP33_9TELE|nr:hypothetical protein AAFF_G00346830 [Aldrovandia affinis]